MYELLWVQIFIIQPSGQVFNRILPLHRNFNIEIMDLYQCPKLLNSLKFYDKNAKR